MNYLAVLVCTALALALILKIVKAEPFGLTVQNVEINPTVAKIGEIVNINMRIKNTGNNTSCNVTAFCGDCLVGVQEISAIAKGSVASLSFKLNTSIMASGIYSIEALIEKPSGEQKIFDLGAVTIEQDEPNTLVIEPKPNPPSSVNPDWLLLLPAGVAVASIPALIWWKWRGKSRDSVISTEKLPLLFNEILKFEEKVEEGVRNTFSRDKEKYVC
ncbi:MAG: CARDB domain-containing protein [Candidatus Bathyarchaeia archaeon]